MRWSELLDDPARLALELSKHGATTKALALDVEDVPELRERCRLLGQRSPERLLLALEWFGDQGHPQPAERTEWHTLGRTPDWGHLPSLDLRGADEPKPRHRPPAGIPVETVKQLKWELAQRKAKPHDREFTQEKVAARLGLTRDRIQQAEGLQRVGWDLRRSHPDFSALDGFVRWPSVREAARLLASERAEN